MNWNGFLMFCETTAPGAGLVILLMLTVRSARASPHAAGLMTDATINNKTPADLSVGQQ